MTLYDVQPGVRTSRFLFLYSANKAEMWIIHCSGVFIWSNVRVPTCSPYSPAVSASACKKKNHLRFKSKSTYLASMNFFFFLGCLPYNAGPKTTATENFIYRELTSLRSFRSALSLTRTSSRGIITPLAWVDGSSRLRTLTDRLSFS